MVLNTEIENISLGRSGDLVNYLDFVIVFEILAVLLNSLISSMAAGIVHHKIYSIRLLDI